MAIDHPVLRPGSTSRGLHPEPDHSPRCLRRPPVVDLGRLSLKSMQPTPGMPGEKVQSQAAFSLFPCSFDETSLSPVASRLGKFSGPNGRADDRQEGNRIEIVYHFASE